MYKELHLDEFAKEIVQAHYNQLVSADEVPSLPAIIGAGVSASSKIPLDNAVREFVANKHHVRNANSYEDIYEGIRKTEAIINADPQLKIELRKSLNDAGIPMLEDQPAPNIANLALIHLLQARLFGPLISLNIDPLLNISAKGSALFYMISLIRTP